MKQKLITLVLTLIAVLVPILIVPTKIFTNVYSYYLKNIVMLVGGLLLLILILANYKKLEIDLKDGLILIFMELVFISTCLSDDKKVSLLGEYTRYEGMLMFASYICIYIAAKKFFMYKDNVKFLNIMFYSSMIIGILGIVQNYISYKDLYPIFGKGIAGTFGNSNFFGTFISMVLPISISIFIFSANKKSFILSLVMFFNMISSGTRSTWVAFIAVAFLGFIYLLKQKNKTYWKRTGLLLLCFIAIFGYLFSGLSKSATRRKINSIAKDISIFSKEGISDNLGSSRMEIWKMTIKLIGKNPFFGCGTDNLRNGLAKDCPEDFLAFVKRTKTIPDKAHNEYLQIAATIGIPALITYLIYICLILLPKMKYMLKDKLMFTISITIISYLVQAFFNISTIGVAPLFWMILGLCDNETFTNQIKEKI